ncbi:hypothetical protein IVB08_02120 [Bradyrhizobium sp. 173]|uniref:hypothetical protein n=1 Tax=Bradyrhizobium sp. 173 TaxID=2782644 RepID=UPI001FF901F7|nr:hypothetical protein [Bradyrhizobium sp. 173]MCK1562805.1 hypothetical protein [Bradyrhizobium sp. 173]
MSDKYLSRRAKAELAVTLDAGTFLDTLVPPIEVKLALCKSYSHLLRGEYADEGTLDNLLDWAVGRGRVIVSGRGASGKTAVLHRAALRAGENGFAPYLIALSRWDQAATEAWKEVRGTSRDALDFLLRRFSSSGQDASDVEFLPPVIQKIFFIDGLNETPGSVADEILDACDEVAAIMVGASFVISDRLVRRNVRDESKWRFVMPMPVQKSEVEKLLSGTNFNVPQGTESLLDSPFFLDRAIKGELRASPLGTIKEMVEARGKLTAEGVAQAACAAYLAYKIDRSRTFSVARFEEAGNPEIANTLAAGGILMPAGAGTVAFSHHWYHDYLASKFVAEHPDLWDFQNRHEVLDILTFKANSFDAIAFVLEMLTARSTGEFIQAVYDWNPYAAGYALAEARIRIDDIPRDVRLVILAMLAERRFDRHHYSAVRASDALDLLTDEDASGMRSAKTLAQLQVLISKIEARSETFTGWRDLFTLETGEPAPPELLGRISDENSILGWTAANVLKRLTLSDEQVKELLDLGQNSRPVVRWRAVHVMGGFVKDQFIIALLKCFDADGDENVRYGALRSVIEIASRDERKVSIIVDELRNRIAVLRSKPRFLNELKRAVFLARDASPGNWSDEVSRLFYDLLDTSASAEETLEWSRIASRLRVHVRSTNQVAA